MSLWGLFTGGATREMPILVSRVAPNTPADKCSPRLTEGDQLVQINGHDVSHALHGAVVQLIQEARGINGGNNVDSTPVSTFIVNFLDREVSIDYPTERSLYWS